MGFPDVINGSCTLRGGVMMPDRLEANVNGRVGLGLSLRRFGVQEICSACLLNSF